MIEKFINKHIDLVSKIDHIDNMIVKETEKIATAKERLNELIGIKKDLKKKIKENHDAQGRYIDEQNNKK